MNTNENTKQRQASFAEVAQEYIAGRSVIFYQGNILIYNGTRYVIEEHLPTKVRRWLIEHQHPHNNHVVSNVVGAIQAISFIDPMRYPAMPFHFGADAFPKDVIAFKNGLLDVERRELMPHSETWVSTVRLPYDYNPEATCPEWLGFLADVLDADEQRIGLLQEWFGYCLLPDTSQQKLLCKVGPPRAGKGTTDRVLEALVGADNTTAYDLHSLAERFGLRRLVGKYVATIWEVNLQQSKDKYRILEKLNSIVGGDPQPIEHKGMNATPTVALPTRFVLSCNELPYFGDPTGALAARLLILPFNRSYVGSEDRGLSGKLLGELPGINRWALEGLARLRRQGGFSRCDGTDERATMFRRENSDAFAFMQDCLIVESRINPGNLQGVQLSSEPQLCTAEALTDAYRSWCAEGVIASDIRWVLKSLQAIIPRLRVDRRRVDGKRHRVYLGVGVARDPQS